MLPLPEQKRMPVSLRRLFPRSSFVGCADIPVSDVSDHSDRCGPSTLFAAIPGTRVDGTQYASLAISRGANALMVESPLSSVSVPQCVVSDIRSAYAELCAALAGHPSQRMKIAGVTGTNGKTTVTWLIRSILQAADRQTGLLGTIEYNDGRVAKVSGLTTPDSKTLSNWLGAMVEKRTTHAAIEMSSHALDQRRCSGTKIDVAVVTNVTQDHFDYHNDFDSYLASKSRILEHCKPGACVVLNADDPACMSMVRQLTDNLRLTTFGMQVAADVTAEIYDESLAGSRFILKTEAGTVDVRTTLAGRHNVSNCLAAAATAIQFGISLEDIAAGIESLVSVPGRLERVDCGQPFEVFVDYAHTDDALRRCVRFVKKLTAGRTICVFGAGGDRDRSKRPLLGKAAAESDMAVVTSDNPRSEDPQAIIGDILPGLNGAAHRHHVEIDRAEAIQWALKHAEPGDTVLIAGKGHETRQIIGSESIPFDDRKIICEFLEQPTPASVDLCVKMPA